MNRRSTNEDRLLGWELIGAWIVIVFLSFCLVLGFYDIAKVVFEWVFALAQAIAGQ